MGAAVVAGLLLSACGGNDDDEAEPTTTTAEATTTTTERATTTSATPACPAVTVPADAQEVTSLDGDLDGDGTADELDSYRLGEEWHLQVALAGDGGADLVIPSFGSTVGVLGGADVDGDGTDELWARTGSGASATIIGLVRLVDCDLVRVSFADGQPADLPVGGSVGTTSGVECAVADDEGTARVMAHLTTLTGESSYDVVTTTYVLDGTTLTATGTATTTVEASDADFPRYTSFSCGDLFL